MSLTGTCRSKWTKADIDQSIYLITELKREPGSLGGGGSATDLTEILKMPTYSDSEAFTRIAGGIWSYFKNDFTSHLSLWSFPIWLYLGKAPNN